MPMWFIRKWDKAKSERFIVILLSYQNREGRTVRSAASRESLCDSLWIKTGCALSERAPSGPAGFDPATSSPCEALFG